MKGDYTRKTFDVKKLYNSVRMQQGRVQLDADWNEQIDVQNHLSRTQSGDVIGACGAPRLDGGFAISAHNNDLEISPGRFYVDGLLCENIPAQGESGDALPVIYSQQPFLPNAPGPGSLSSEGTDLYLIYVDVWERHITAVEDRSIREVALGGPDTATRMQTVWQVKLMRLEEPELPPSCWDVSPEWDALTHATKGKLNARTDRTLSAEDPCIVPAAAGFRRLENQLYRVEIHADSPGATTFKWSRDNGIVVTRLLSIHTTDDTLLTVADIGKDSVLSFAPGRWVEVTDEPRVLHGEPGILVRLASVEANNIKIEGWPGGGTPPVLDLDTATVRRWDHKGTGSQDLNASGGALPLQIGDWIKLEDGVEVFFELDPQASFKTGDYWLIPARVVGGDIEWPSDSEGEPVAVPPHGIDHHYCRLALARWDGESFLPLSEAETELRDCRPLFPALTEPDLYPISGDGQEAMPGETLPQPLRVGVVNCNRPVQGAWVKFEIIDGVGTLEPDTNIPGYTQLADNGAGGITAFILPTDGKGEVKTDWRLQTLIPETDDPGQLVKATLLIEPDPGLATDPQNQLDVPVLFGASFGVAWQDRYGGARFPNPPFIQLAALTVERAIDQLRENVALYCVSGDGQEVPRASLTLPSEEDPEPVQPRIALPHPLEVRVANGDWPFAGATVTFSVVSGAGSLSPESVPGDFLQVLQVQTDSDGIARCYWELDSTNWSQQVSAALDPIHPEETQKPWPYVSDSVLRFNANLSVAEKVTYDGSPFPDEQHGELRVETVEDALDQLRENVTLYFASGDGQEAMPGEQLPQALQVRVANNDWPYEAATVRFIISEGTGTIIPPESGATVISSAEITVMSNTEGLAECFFQLDDDNHSQQITASVESSEGHSFVSASPIRFNATTSTADQVFYDSSSTTGRWSDINDDAALPAPDTVQTAIDNLVTNMESGDIGYLVPECPPAPEGVPLFKELLDASGTTNLKVLWDKLLCRLDAARVPYNPNNRLARWQDIMDPGESGATGEHLWSRNFKSTSTEIGYRIAIDMDNNVLVTGYFNGTVNFGGEDLTSAGIFDTFVVKLAPNGNHQWSQRFGGTVNDIGQDITVDNNGNALLTGYFSGTINFGGEDLTSAGSNDLFVVKLARDGTHQWSQRFGGVSSEFPSGIAVDNSGNVLLIGYFTGTINFGGEDLTSAGSNDLFVVKLAPSGTHQWSRRFGGTGSDIARDIAVDNNGNLLVTGSFNSTINFGGGDLTSVGSNDLFVVKLNPDGAHIWSQGFGGVNADNAQAVAVDNNGNVLLTGFFAGTTNFGGGDLTSAGSNDVFVVKLGPNGKHLWSQRFGGVSSDVGMGIAVDSNGVVVLSGFFTGTTNFGGEDLTSAGSNDLFVARLEPDGAHQWSQRFGGTGSDIGRAISVDNDDNMLLTGTFSGTVNFGGEDLTSTGQDLYVVKLRGQVVIPVTVQSAIDFLLDNLESSDIHYRGRNVKDVLDELMRVASNVAIPAGTVIAYSSSTPPEGWLECNGQAISRTNYAPLYNSISTTYGAGDGQTTFNVPDLRGEFVRGWDNGRGVDPGRSMGGLQLDQMRQHTHNYVVANSRVNIWGLAPGLGGLAQPLNGQTTTGSGGVNTDRVGNETRSRNIALMYCIKT